MLVPNTRISKIHLLEDLYLQLVEEMTCAENELIHADQVTTILSDKYVFELKFKKKTVRVFTLIDNETN